MSKAPNGTFSDAQLQAVNAFTEAHSLLEVMLRKFYAVERKSGDPFLLRVVVAGKKNENASRSAGLFLSELLDKAVETSENPLSEKSTTMMKPSGLLIEYDTHFIELIEGVERHIILFLKLLEKHCAEKEEASCSDVRILYFVDDVHSSSSASFHYIDKVPAMSTEDEIQEKTEEEIANMIVEDLHNLMKLLDMAAGEPSSKRKLLLDNLRVTHPLLFPRISSINTYLGGDLCLTLSECVSLFGKLPELTRDIELNHPVEDPLKY
ncbi:uncharacterized protein Tco025E_10068 [Trypanosoma conorhini]|uniref:Uncharacterized protein n=1 Tax=Trypanosoma conorhini TaxID=83891 RepID=A0A3R7M376_9TRYP|nr:uncharacterized protein Tco025E_10068 [Trypanosoma conorhini]RNE95318.1 hypothetical protein Tco025E_10068 [Trypanosoma conorhini]